MFGKKKTGPDRPYVHAEGCPIVRADPDVRIPWNEVERGHFVRTCVCAGAEHHREPVVEDRVRLDPLDPSTARHAGECEFVGTTDPTVLRLALTVTQKDGYSSVACSACACSWQVADFAEAG
jgi:hypothetical protein